MKKFIGEFKKFISRGNVMELAIGIIIGGAFKAIVDSFVADIINPIIGILGGMDFTDMTVRLGSGDTAPELKYGSFITAVINFLIVALILFLMISAINKVSDLTKKKEAEEPKKIRKCDYCKSEIDDEATRCPHCTSQLEVVKAE